MVYSIFTPHLLYWLKHVDASWNYSAGLLSLLVQTWLFISCVNIGIGGRGELIESNSSLRKYCDSGDQCVYLLSANMTEKTGV